MPKLTVTFLLVLVSSLSPAAGVTVLSDPRDPNIGPYPTDFLTIEDVHQRTGRRMAMPLPDCLAEPSTCAELRLINQLDGFSLLPRLHVRFSGAIDPQSLRSALYFVALDKLSCCEPGLGPAGEVIPVNQVVYDPRTNTAYALPDSPLDQTRRYAVIVTDALRDAAGASMDPEPGFQACLDGHVGADYCASVSAAVALARERFLPAKIIGASVFTTMSATAFMESAWRQIQNSSPMFQRTGDRNVFDASDISSIAFHPQTNTSGPLSTVEFPVPLPLLLNAGLGRIAFGSFRSLRFLNSSYSIDTIPTADEVPPPADSEEIFFQAYLPATPPPDSGYPVVIVGHGLGGNRFDLSSALIPGLVSQGFAILAFNAVGHGFGPHGTLVITDRSGKSTTLPAGGRGTDIDGNGNIDNFEGSILLSLESPIFIRDSIRQTALDVSQLVRAIKLGMDLDGDGRADFDASRLSYLGVSYGSFEGSLVQAIEPDIASAVLNVGGGSAVQTARLSLSFHLLAGLYLALHKPLLLNKGLEFDDNAPLRFEPVRVNDVAGAIAIQDAFERLEWIETPGAPYAFATHFRSSTLPGVPLKRTLFQFAVGDTTIPNPVNLLLLRAANTWDTASVYRNDIARSVEPRIDKNPHSFIAMFDPPAALAVSLAAQQQAASFLKGQDTPLDVNPSLRIIFGKDLFEPPSFLLEKLNFAQ